MKLIPPIIEPSSIVANSEEESEGQGILESFSKLPRTERELIRKLLEKFDSDGVGVIRFPIPFGREKSKDRRLFLLPIYRLIRYHRLNFDSIVDGAIRVDLCALDRVDHDDQNVESKKNSSFDLMEITRKSGAH